MNKPRKGAIFKSLRFSEKENRNLLNIDKKKNN